VIDCNRQPSRHDAMTRLSELTEIPGHRRRTRPAARRRPDQPAARGPQLHAGLQEPVATLAHRPALQSRRPRGAGPHGAHGPGAGPRGRRQRTLCHHR
jgi:hypothetical protein